MWSLWVFTNARFTGGRPLNLYGRTLTIEVQAKQATKEMAMRWFQEYK